MKYGANQQMMTALADQIETVIKNEFHHARMLYTFIQTADNKTIANIDIATGYPFKQKWNLLDNLKFAAEDEANEANLIYPEYAKTAKAEGFLDIAGLFNNLIQVETCHKLLFEQLYDQMKNATMYKKPQKVKWKCMDCGYESESKEAWTICPLCQAKQGACMIQIEESGSPKKMRLWEDDSEFKNAPAKGHSKSDAARV
jgi:rubrerythrin